MKEKLYKCMKQFHLKRYLNIKNLKRMWWGGGGATNLVISTNFIVSGGLYGIGNCVELSSNPKFSFSLQYA